MQTSNQLFQAILSWREIFSYSRLRKIHYPTYYTAICQHEKTQIVYQHSPISPLRFWNFNCLMIKTSKAASFCLANMIVFVFKGHSQDAFYFIWKFWFWAVFSNCLINANLLRCLFALPTWLLFCHYFLKMFFSLPYREIHCPALCCLVIIVGLLCLTSKEKQVHTHLW